MDNPCPTRRTWHRQAAAAAVRFGDRSAQAGPAVGDHLGGVQRGEVDFVGVAGVALDAESSPGGVSGNLSQLQLTV